MFDDHGLFFSYEGQQGGANGKIRGTFSKDMHRTLDGWMLAHTPASPAQGIYFHGPQYFNFPYFCMTCGPKKLGPVDQNRLGRDFPALLLRTLAVGRRQQSESIEAALVTK